jgi:hypothetical protein
MCFISMLALILGRQKKNQMDKQVLTDNTPDFKHHQNRITFVLTPIICEKYSRPPEKQATRVYRQAKLLLFFFFFSFKVCGQGVDSPCSGLFCTGCDVGLVCIGTIFSCTCQPLSPLPIELTTFDVKQIDNKIEITWTTATEINNDFFTIERSADGINFYEIKKIKGAGNSSTSKHYSIYDIEPPTGINYYRLKQTDYDGKYKYYELKAIEFISITTLITYNWTDDFLKITITSDKRKDVFISVINVIGQTIYYQNIRINKGVNQIDIDLSRQTMTLLFSCLVIDNKPIYKKIIQQN